MVLTGPKDIAVVIFTGQFKSLKHKLIMKNKPKISKIKNSDSLIGKQLPSHLDGGASGRAVEEILENEFGFQINTGAGADIPDWNLEVKTRCTSATSPQTVATMSADDIVCTPYEDSIVAEKLQQQLRIKHNEYNIITSADVYDFSKPFIQEELKKAYEHGRNQIRNNESVGCTSCKGGYLGYFEQCHSPRSSAYSFRLSLGQMRKLESMAKSTFTSLFREEV